MGFNRRALGVKLMENCVKVNLELNGGPAGEAYLSRIGVSDTLYADRVGNIFHKTRPGIPVETTPFNGIGRDTEGAVFMELLPVEESQSTFYKMNIRLIEQAMSRAHNTQGK